MARWAANARGSAVRRCFRGQKRIELVEDHAERVLATAKTQREAIDWAKARGHEPLVPRVRYLNDKKKPDHWRSTP